MSVEQKVTYCRICEPLCGLIATVEDGRLQSLRPDKNHPLSQGRACPKGIAFTDVQNDPDRVLAPLRRQPDGSFAYTPAAGFSGLKEFAYTMTDGTSTSDWASVSITVTAAPVTGGGLPGGGLVPSIPGDPGTGGSTPSTTDLPTLAYTGGTDDVATWLAAPAGALIGLGGLGVWYSRRRAQHSL